MKEDRRTVQIGSYQVIKNQRKIMNDHVPNPETQDSIQLIHVIT